MIKFRKLLPRRTLNGFVKCRMRKTKSAVRNGETKGRDLQVKRFSYLPAGFCVPDPHRLVRRDGNHARAVPAKARRVNAALVAQRFAHRLAGVRIPDPCCIVSRQGHNQRAICTEAGRIDRGLMEQRFADRLAIFHVPDPCSLIRRSAGRCSYPRSAPYCQPMR